MAKRSLVTHRRAILAGLGAAALAPALSRLAHGEQRELLLLHARMDAISLRGGQPPSPIWSLQGPTPNAVPRFKRGTWVEMSLQNALPAALALHCRGLDGVAANEPLGIQPPLPPGGTGTFSALFRHAGTLLCDIRLLGDATRKPSRPMPLIVEENEPVAVDHDVVFLVEDFLVGADGTAAEIDTPPEDVRPVFTINGQITPDIVAAWGERLRFRFINGCQRLVVALKIEEHEIRVMALDGQPAEPFVARNSAIVLAPGGRADAFVDATDRPGSRSPILLHDGKEARPVATLAVSLEPARRADPRPPASALPSNGLPAQLELKGAARFDVSLGGWAWVPPKNFSMSVDPAFRIKRGRVVVLAVTNSGPLPVTMHLHGHHFRLLDRLDDGWKPYWLDTLVFEAGQTQRIAFLAEYAGRWLIECFATHWAAPRLVRWYSVE